MVMLIMIGNVSQWGEVKKKSKDKVATKSKDTHVDSNEQFSRGTRSRGGDGSRGNRARGTERGRGRGRYKDNISHRTPVESNVEAAVAIGESVDTPAESHPASEAWEQPAPTTTSEESSWDVVNSAEAPPVAAVEQSRKSSKPDGTRTWASMFAQKPKPKPVSPASKVASKSVTLSESVHPMSMTEESYAPTLTTIDPPVEDAGATLPLAVTNTEPALDITPSNDQLTETNLQQVPGSPQQPATATVVSNAGTNEARTGSSINTPVPGVSTGQQPIRPGLGGFQTSALKATTITPRSSSFGRRVKEQQEAVVMPGNHAVDRTAVQFGSLGLGNSSTDLEADDDREQPETRTQPPQHSPVAPKASLPIISQQAHAESAKAAPGLTAPGTNSSTFQDQMQTQASGQNAHPYHQFGNVYGHPGQSDNNAAQKAYEPFGQPTAQGFSGSSNGYPTHSQAPGQSAQSAYQSRIGGVSSAATDYSSYYTSDQQRNAYNLYGSYGQGPQDLSQKSHNGFGSTSASELPATVATSQGPHPNQTRFGALDQSSGNSTPNPPATSQAQTQQAQQVGQSHANQPAAYPYGATNPYYGNYYPNYMGQHSYGRDRPPFDDVRRYEEQFIGQSQHYGFGANQGGYGAGPYGGGKYGQPHQGYGMPSQSWDGHAGSPANTGSYTQQPGTGRDNSTGQSGYGRTGATQPSEGQQQSSSAFGSMPDVFGRAGSAYGAQGSHQQGQQGSIDEISRGYDNSSKVAGTSPALGQSAGRPDSAVNIQGQPSQGQNQHHYGSYPGHGQQSHYASNYGHQNTTQGHQTGGYGAYAGFGSNYYGGNNSRGNWSGNYGH